MKINHKLFFKVLFVLVVAAIIWQIYPYRYAETSLSDIAIKKMVRNEQYNPLNQNFTVTAVEKKEAIIAIKLENELDKADVRIIVFSKNFILPYYKLNDIVSSSETLTQNFTTVIDTFKDLYIVSVGTKEVFTIELKKQVLGERVGWFAIAMFAVYGLILYRFKDNL